MPNKLVMVIVYVKRQMMGSPFREVSNLLDYNIGGFIMTFVIVISSVLKRELYSMCGNLH